MLTVYVVEDPSNPTSNEWKRLLLFSFELAQSLWLCKFNSHLEVIVPTSYWKRSKQGKDEHLSHVTEKGHFVCLDLYYCISSYF